MVNVHDVAAYILRARGRMTTMKLQKLMYYAHAWSLAWDGVPLFPQRLKAWENGPVVPEVWKRAQGAMHVSAWPSGNPEGVPAAQRPALDEVLRFYGELEGDLLSELTHREAPWREARERAGADRSPPITDDSLRRFFGPVAAQAPSHQIPEALSRGLRTLLAMPEELAAAADEPSTEVDPDDFLRSLGA